MGWKSTGQTYIYIYIYIEKIKTCILKNKKFKWLPANVNTIKFIYHSTKCDIIKCDISVITTPKKSNFQVAYIVSNVAFFHHLEDLL